MITSPVTTKRLLIPRWRSFEATVASGELGARKRVKIPAARAENETELVRRQQNWHQSPSVVTAAEFVESAIVWGVEESASSAAEFLVGVHGNVPPLLRWQSQQLLGRLHNELKPHTSPGALTPHTSPGAPIRERLRENPDDAVLWVELALSQVISGADESARRSMRTAIQLAPNNRYVLRSAARLASHLHIPDYGYDLLRRSPSTEYDPWLMSAEVAMAGRIGKRSVFLKRGLAILDADSSDGFELSELAGAAATTFLDGEIPKKRARNLFKQSLAVPTDNAVAQAEWASQATGERFLDVNRVTVFQRAKEARAMHAYSVGDYRAALMASREWIAEEPFSGRAYATAAAAANTMDDYATAISISQDGIKHDPRSASLRNSLVFALACSGKLREAEQALQETKSYSVDRVSELVAEANRGLIAFRRGQFENGEAMYNNAISGFRQIGSDYLATSALAYLAREAASSGHLRAKDFLHQAQRALERRPHPAAEKIVKQIEAASNSTSP